MHPRGVFCPPPTIEEAENGGGGRGGDPPAKAGIWREISVGGGVFGLRESRSAAAQGSPVPEESGELRDGTLVDLCGATLLWRSADGLARSPTPRQLERCLDALNAGRPQCPVGLYTLVVPTRKSSGQLAPEAQPVVYLSCGHVQGRHQWGSLDDSKGTRTCPICLAATATAQLMMGSEPGGTSGIVIIFWQFKSWGGTLIQQS